ncbi:hypothetical protein ACFWSF_11250 [Streptomyces sp. NPDC058611]
MTPRPTLDSVRRFLRQERDDAWAVRPSAYSHPTGGPGWRL